MSDILFYDGNCSLCAKEIKLLARHKDSTLMLVNIHSDQKQQYAANFTDLELLSVLHLKTANGEWLKGLDATVSAWKHTKFGWLFTPLRWPIIAAGADWAYQKWANKRACDLGYCTKSVN